MRTIVKLTDTWVEPKYKKIFFTWHGRAMNELMPKDLITTYLDGQWSISLSGNLSNLAVMTQGREISGKNRSNNTPIG